MDRQPRQISIDGAPLVGAGAHADVYRLDDETVVKLYRPFVTMESIEREKKLSRWAFVKGIPTAISFDIVKAGDRDGIVYELIKARSVSEYIQEAEGNFDIFVRKYMDLMHQIHSVEVKPDELPDMKKQALGWAETCRNYMSSDICNRLISLVEEISDCHTLLHADFHINNILVCGDELMLIDMDTLCFGDPIFEMSSLYNSYIEFPSIDPVAAKIFGIDVETARRLWDSSLELYLGGDKDKKNEFARKVLLLGCMRIIDFMNRHKDHPGFERCINICSQDISKHL
jgi:uncharacterized protein (TIGR02172 family)